MNEEALFADDITQALIPSDQISTLCAEYRGLVERVERIVRFFDADMLPVLSFFLDGRVKDNHGHPTSLRRSEIEALISRDGAVAALNSHFWNRAIRLTDCLDVMSQKRRDEWYEQIRDNKCPPFDEQTVRDTILTLLNDRSKHLAERVDNAFQGLSGKHVTNSPSAFGKRMIVAGVLDGHGFGQHSKLGMINDLRCVIARFMRRTEPKYGATSALLEHLKANRGEWCEVDGGAMRLKVYSVGTAHIEIHPDMAWRLNSVLATLYPRTIPPEHRERPKKHPKDEVAIMRPLPQEVLEVLAEAKHHHERVENPQRSWEMRSQRVPNSLSVNTYNISKHLKAEVESVLESIGGVDKGSHWVFDFEPLGIVRQIVVSGVVPDDKTHQFFPTPEVVAQHVAEIADAQPQHRVLEPSAGLGALAAAVKGNVTCIELSALRCAVLRAKGFSVVQADFLKWAAEARLHASFDRIVMNPPFDGGRWRAHLEAAIELVAPKGVLVSVLPDSARANPPQFKGFTLTVGKTFVRAFANTSVSVVVLRYERAS